MEMFETKPRPFYQRRSFIYVFAFFIFSILAAVTFFYAEPLRVLLGIEKENTESGYNQESTEQEIIYDYYKKPRMDDETLDPWNWADDELETEPEMPSEYLLIELYRNVREAADELDYQKFKDNISSEIIWHIENNKLIVGVTKDGYQVFELVEPTGEESFIQDPYAYAAITLPELESVEFESYELSDDLYLKNQDRIIVISDTNRNEGTYIKLSGWRYSVIAKVTCGESCDYSDGYVFFVYDNGEWKYYRETWKSI